MNNSNVVELALEMVSEMVGSPKGWNRHEWADAISRAIGLIGEEDSAFRLGEVLRADFGLDLPHQVVIASYRRLIALGVNDVHTRLCFGRYLLLQGPEFDAEASAILEDVQPAAEQAGLWDSDLIGHHPTFYAGPS